MLTVKVMDSPKAWNIRDVRFEGWRKERREEKISRHFRVEEAVNCGLVPAPFDMVAARAESLIIRSL